MCKSDFHESTWNCAELTDISDIFIGKKIPEILLFPLLSYTRSKSRKYVIFATSNGYSSNTKERESQCIRLIDFLSQVYRLALVSARNMQVTLGPNLSSISCQNREKFEPLLLAC